MLARNPEREQEGKRQMGAATLGRVHATLRAALNAAVRRRLVPFNVATHVELPSSRRPPVVVWLPEQAGAFLDRVTAAGDRLAPLFHVTVFAGLRRGEAIGLRWVDLDLDAGQLRVAQSIGQIDYRIVVTAPKTRGSLRVVSLDAETVGVLRAHRQAQLEQRLLWGAAWVDSGLVFTKENGEGLHPEHVSNRFRRLTLDAGLPVIRFHDLRHTSASLGLASGETLKEVSERLGHSTITITADTYTHVLPATARESAERRGRSHPPGLS